MNLKQNYVKLPYFVSVSKAKSSMFNGHCRACLVKDLSCAVRLSQGAVHRKGATHHISEQTLLAGESVETPELNQLQMQDVGAALRGDARFDARRHRHFRQLHYSTRMTPASPIICQGRPSSVSGCRKHLDGRGRGLQPQAVGDQRCGSSSSIRLAG